MTVNLSVLERLLAEATKRPWRQDDGVLVSGHGQIGDAGFNGEAYFSDEDAALIVEAVSALPALITAVKALRNAVVLESAADFTDDENADLRQRAEACYAALAAFSSEEQA